jgi:hypothetical protein
LHAIEHEDLTLVQDGNRYTVLDNDGGTVASFEGRNLAPLLAILQEADAERLLAGLEDELDEILGDSSEEPLDWTLEPEPW